VIPQVTDLGEFLDGVVNNCPSKILPLILDRLYSELKNDASSSDLRVVLFVGALHRQTA
jgi:hypothetical protein